jgi:hypothetical protein
MAVGLKTHMLALHCYILMEKHNVLLVEKNHSPDNLLMDEVSALDVTGAAKQTEKVKTAIELHTHMLALHCYIMMEEYNVLLVGKRPISNHSPDEPLMDEASALEVTRAAKQTKKSKVAAGLHPNASFARPYHDGRI